MNIGFAGLLTICLIVLKLIGFISLGWLWVLSPIWIPFALVIIMSAVIVIMAKK
jgi:hypothetical protein